MADQFLYVQNQPTTLYGSGAVLGATSVILTNFTRIDGTLLTMADFGAIGFGTIEPGNGTQEEQICWTGVTQNANSTATLTGVKTVLTVSPYTQTSGLATTHPGGAQFVVSNTAGFYDKLISKSDDETITGKYTFPAGGSAGAPVSGTSYSAPTDSLEYASKGYVDSVAVAGAPNATTTVKGIVQLATATQLQTGTAVGSTGANLVPATSSFNSTSTATILVPVTNTNGKISATFGSEALSLATLDVSAKVVQDPAKATVTPSASRIPISNGSGYLNVWIDGDSLTGNSTNIRTFVAGENIDASSGPKALYLKESDGRVYKLDSTAAGEASFAFVGFAIVQSAVTTGNNISVQTAGVVAGFSGLTVGGYYFGTNTAGSISTTAGTISLQVGRAVTATTLLIQVGKKVASGVVTFSSTTTSGVTVGFRPSKVSVFATTSGGFYSSGGWDATSGNLCAWRGNGGAGTNTTGWALTETATIAGTSHTGTVTTIVSTGFTLSNVKAGAPADAQLHYFAEG